MAKKNSDQITVKGRLLGGGVFEPRGDKDEYSACVVLADGEEAKIQALTKKVVSEKFGSKVPASLQDWTVRLGDDPDFENSYEKFYVNPKSSDPVGIFVRRNGELKETTKSDGVVYPGCYVAVSVSAYAYDGNREKNIKPGVTLSFRGLLFVEDGEPLGRSFNAEDEFEGFESLVDDDDLGDALDGIPF